jgi:NAD/NADP transhydrogenase beta subunit
MPVVISLLNSYSGVAAAAAGFVVGSQLLIVAGAMVGAAGLILTQVMCTGMNRSLLSVLFGGALGGSAPVGGGGDEDVGAGDRRTGGYSREGVHHGHARHHRGGRGAELGPGDL